MADKPLMNLDQMYDQLVTLPGWKEMLYDWMGANHWLFAHINSIRAGWYDSLMVAITHAGQSRNFPYYLLALAGYVCVSTIARKIMGKGGTKQYLTSWVGVFAALIIGFGANVAMIKIAKEHFHYPRPYIAMAVDPLYADYHPTVLDRGSDPEDDYHSFPSGHAGFATLLVVALWPMLTGNMQWLASFYIFLMGWSRIAVGMHFPADVVDTFVLSFILIVVLRMIIYRVLRAVGINCG